MTCYVDLDEWFEKDLDAHTLCGKRVKYAQITTLEQEATCVDCREILSRIETRKINRER